MLLCYPIGSEYVSSHRTFRQLANRLSRSGFPVLRFDYFGTGDSEGDGERVSLAQCVEDAAEAAGELRARSSGRIGVIGLGLGASIGLLAAATDRTIAASVLWDPVVDGEAYVKRVLEASEESGCDAPREDGGACDFLGFPLSVAFRRELVGLDLTRIDAAPGRCLVLGADDTSGRELVEPVRRTGGDIEHQSVDAPGMRLDNVDRVNVPMEAVNGIVRWLTKLPEDA